MSCGTLIVVAMRLECQYPRDPCSKHKLETGFTQCDNCNVRELAEQADKEQARPE